VPGAVGSLVEGPDDPWLSALVPEGPGVDLAPALAAIGDAPLAVFTCTPRQAAAAHAASFAEVVARQAAMGGVLPLAGAPASDVEAGVDLAAVGALNDRAYGSTARSIERALGRLPPAAVHAYGRRSPDGALLAAALVHDRDDDSGVQYVATDPAARRAGHASAVLRRALADAAGRGGRTSTLVASDAGRGLYERLGYRVAGTVEVRRRPRG
jgi:ribosomal protein S18 acetylase RimI-like enzyme